MKHDSHDTIDDTTTTPTSTGPGYQTQAAGKTTAAPIARDDSPVSFAQSLEDLIAEENESGFVDETGQAVQTPENQDSQASSGHMPDPESDDDVTQMAHQMGLHQDENYEEPEELTIGKAVQEAERLHRQGGDDTR